MDAAELLINWTNNDTFVGEYISIYFQSDDVILLGAHPLPSRRNSAAAK
jgi:hypothetical protein